MKFGKKIKPHKAFGSLNCKTPDMVRFSPYTTFNRESAGLERAGVSQKIHTCFNCYQYEINGKVYKEWSNTGCMPGKFTVGDIVELCYNDNNPKQFYVEKENNNVINNVFVLVSIILLLFGIVLLYINSNL